MMEIRLRRSRRNKQGQARDILLALLKDQEAKAAKHKAAYEGAELTVTSTRRAIELLDQTMLPGMEPQMICTCDYNPDTGYRLDVHCGVHHRFLFPVPGYPSPLIAPAFPVLGGEDSTRGATVQGDDDAEPPVGVEPIGAEGEQLPRIFNPKRDAHLVACVHERTGMVDGVRRCFACNEMVFEIPLDMAIEITEDFGKGDA